MSPSATLPVVMQDRDVDVHQYPDHANVLAVVHAYTNAVGPMPYALLKEVMESLEAVGDETAIKQVGPNGLAVALHNIVTDLRRLDLIDLGPSGTVLTACGHERLRAWNGQFRSRSEHATAILGDLAFIAS